MNSIRKTLVIVTGMAALGTASASFAGLNSLSAERNSDGDNQQAQPAERPAQAQAPQQQRQGGQRPQRQQAQASQAQGSQPQRSQPQGAQTYQRQSPPQGAQSYQQRQVRPEQAQGQTQMAAAQRDRSGYPANRGGSRNGAETPRYDGNNGGPGRGYVRGDRNGRGNGYYNGNRAPRYVHSLPRGYRNYNWNGGSYYAYGGSWYRPYGSSYISIGVPYGLFVSTLPGYSNSFWYGNSRYYYYDNNYYMYEPERRGYVVSHSPYGDDPAESTDQQTSEDELFIYPAKGQSEQQQSDDRYECHRWAADETHYDPIDDAYSADQHAAYLRATTACLTGRGYTVK